jgi:hypothetical protein
MANLGTDFLRAHKLIVNPAAAGKLVQAGTGFSLSTSSEATASAIRPELAIVPTAVTVLHGQAATDF